MASQFKEVLAMRKMVQVESLGVHVEEDEAVIEARTRTFVRWINGCLHSKGIHIKNLDTDLESGVVLIKLLETLAHGKRIPESLRYYGHPVIRIQKVQNLMVAFRFLTEVEKIPLMNIKPNDFLEHNQSAILSLLWILILHYQLNYTLKKGVVIEMTVFLLKRSFLTWINSILTGFTITNLTTDWRDGRALTALCDYYKPGIVTDSASVKSSDVVLNIQNIMHLAEYHFKIPQVVSPKDFAAEKPDERSVMMYLSYFVGAVSPGQAALLEWIHEQIPEQRVTNLTSDWLDGRVLGALTNAISEGKFAAYAEMASENATQNIEQSMISAEKMLGVRRIIKVDEFANPNLDRIFRFSYLSQFYHAKMSNNAPALIPPAPDKVEVSQVQVPEAIGDGKDVWVQIDCSDAGYGTPQAEAEGRNAGSVPVQIHEIKGDDEGYGTDKYIVKFSPHEVDVYKFSIFYGDDHVPGSPFAVNLHPPNPEGVKHIKKDNPSESDEHVSLTFNTVEAGRGKLMAKATGEIIGSVPIKINIEADGTYVITFIPQTPDIYMVDVLWGKFSAHAIGETSGPIPLQVDRDRRSEYKVSFKPPNPDVYVVDMNWEGKPVPGSPFMIDLLPPPQPEKVECTVPIYSDPGKKAEILVDASNAGSGKLKAQCFGEKTGEVDVELIKVKGRTFQISFNPPEKDLYTLSILFDDKHVKGSPFTIDMRLEMELEFGEIKEKPPSPDDVTVSGLSNRCYIGQPLDFTVDATKGGIGGVAVKASCPKNQKDKSKLTVSDNKDGTYSINYVPHTIGEHQFAIQWAGKSIPGSPFSTSAVEYIADMVSEVYFIEGPGLPVERHRSVEPAGGDLNALLGTDTVLEIKINDEYKDAKLNAAAVGNTTGPVDLTVTKPADDTFTITLRPTEADTYTITAKLDNKEVPKSPVTVTYTRPKADASKCRILDADKLHSTLYTSKLVSFRVATAEAGPGELDVKAEAPDVQEPATVKFEPSKEESSIYNVTYIPTTPGTHKLHVLWDNQPVPDSPVDLQVASPPSYTYGQPVVKDINADCKPSDLTAHVVHVDSNTQYMVKITKVQKGKFKLSFQPKDPGYYHIHMYVKQVEVPGSPFVIYYGKPPQPDKVVVKDISEDMYVGDDIHFTIDCTEAGSGELNIKVSVPPGASSPDVRINDNKDGTYAIDMTPAIAGDYTFDVLWANESVPTAPFTIPVKDFGSLLDPIRPEAVVVIGLVDKCYLGETLKFIVNATQAGDGDLQIEFDRKDKGKLDITEAAHATYSVEFTPAAPGSEKLYITWAGRPVPDSPHSVFVKDHAEEELITWLFLVDRVNKQYQVDFPENELQATMADTMLLRVMARTDEQKDGKFVVTATDLSTHKKAKVTVSKEGDNIFEASFLPEVPHSYSINAQLNDEQVPNTPFIVNYTIAPPVAGECKILGLENLPPHFQVDRPIHFQIDTRLAGDGKLNIAADYPQITRTQTQTQIKPKFEAKPSQSDPRIIDVEYVPTAPGTHNLKIGWLGEPIPKSPLVFEVEGINAYPYGKPVTFVLDIDGKSSELEAYAIHVDSNTRLTMKISIEVLKGKFNFTFEPKLPGLYAIHILLRKKEISNSPIYIRYEFPPKPEAVDIADVPEECYLQEPYMFTVNATQAGSADLGVKVTSPAKGKEDEVTVTDHQDGTYTIQHIPEAIGNHSFVITWDGKQVPGSPVKTAVKKRVPEVKHCFGPFINLVPVNKPVYLQVVNVGKHENSAFLDVEVSAPDNDDKATITKQENDNYFIEFVPIEPKDYSLSVKLHGEAIKDSPFIIKAVEPASLDKDFDHPSGICHSDVEVGQPVCLLIPRDESLPADTLFVDTKGPFGLCETTVSDNLESSYGLNFTPIFPGDYLVHVKPNKESDDEIENSPFKVVAAKKESAVQKVYIPEEYSTLFVDLFCKVKGVNLDGEKFQTGSPYKFKVECNQVLEGQLDVTCSEPKAAEVQITPLQRAYECILTPTLIGDYQISVMYNGYHIEGSPFNVNFHHPPSAGISFSVNAKEAETSDFSATVQSALSLEQLPVQLSQLFGGQYSLEFVPTQGLEYLVTIKCRVKMAAEVKEVAGSPFYLSYAKEATDASKCVVDFEGAGKAVVGVQNSFSILTEGAGSGQLNVVIDGPDTKPTVSVHQIGSSKIEVKYTLYRGGNYSIALTWDGEPIPGSPFEIECVAPEDLFGRPKFPTEDAYDEPLSFSLKPQSGEVVIVAQSEMHGIAPGVVKHTDGTYLCSVDLNHPGRYAVEVTQTRTQIQTQSPIEGAPFDVKVIQTPESEKVTVEGPGLQDGYYY